MNSVDGECNLIINGGKFKGSVYAVSRVGSVSTATNAEMNGKVNVTITGGEFSGKIGAVQDGTTAVNGETYLTIPTSLESKISGDFTNVEKK